MSSTPAIEVDRTLPRGANGGNDAICAWRSGGALIRNQSRSFPEIAMHSSRRGRARRVPWRSPSQLGHAQFHCGKPPPAAVPRRRTFTGGGLVRFRIRRDGRCFLSHHLGGIDAGVGRAFAVDRAFFRSRFDPGVLHSLHLIDDGLLVGQALAATRQHSGCDAGVPLSMISCPLRRRTPRGWPETTCCPGRKATRGVTVNVGPFEDNVGVVTSLLLLRSRDNELSRPPNFEHAPHHPRRALTY